MERSPDVAEPALCGQADHITLYLTALCGQADVNMTDLSGYRALTVSPHMHAPHDLTMEPSQRVRLDVPRAAPACPAQLHHALLNFTMPSALFVPACPPCLPVPVSLCASLSLCPCVPLCQPVLRVPITMQLPKCIDHRGAAVGCNGE